MAQEVYDRVVLRIPKDLKIKIMNISHFRKVNDKPSASINAVVLELISKNIGQIVPEEMEAKKMGA